MSEQELMLYQAFENFMTENLFWRLLYLNNASFGTPLSSYTKNKLMSMDKPFENIISKIYPAKEGNELVVAVAQYNRLFIAYVDCLVSNCPEAGKLKREWEEGGQRIARILCKINPYWHKTEWSAMIKHETQLLNSIASNLQTRDYAAFVNTAPICRRLVIDMAAYLSAGILKQREAR
ncbi:hypothetical protein LI291_01160 [Intestinibacillus massiliensis]|nr:hypothetical protein [Intestinibacillus massiliensis]